MKEFKIYNMAPCMFYQHVMKGTLGHTKMKRRLDSQKELTVTLHESTVKIVGYDWTADQYKVVQLEVRPDADNYASNGLCQCRVEFWDVHTRTLSWVWKRDLRYENMEDADDLLRQFFQPSELARFLLRYGVVLDAAPK